MQYQLELFLEDEEKEKCRLEGLKSKIEDVKDRGDKLRRGMFARHGELARKIMDLHERMEIIERNICHD